MSKWKKLFSFLPSESVIKENQQDYYSSLALADNNADSTVFIAFMLEVINHALGQYAPVNVLVNAPVNIKLLKTTDAIIEILSKDKTTTRKEMARLLEKDIRTIGRAIKKLQEKGRLKFESCRG